MQFLPGFQDFLRPYRIVGAVNHARCQRNIGQIRRGFLTALEDNLVPALIDGVERAPPGGPGTDDVAAQHRLAHDRRAVEAVNDVEVSTIGLIDDYGIDISTAAETRSTDFDLPAGIPEIFEGVVAAR